MRRILVSIAIVLLYGALAGFIAYRHGIGRDLSDGEASVATSESTDPQTDPQTDQVAAAAPVPAPTPTPAEPAEPTFVLDRPLRVVCTRWEPAAPVLLAGGGALTSTPDSPVERAHLRQIVRIVSQANEVEEALARGGATEGGADVAILPFATWVAAYEHLAALETEVFFVAGWSRGADVFLLEPALATELTLPRTLAVAGDRASPATLALLMLATEMGVTPENVRFVASDAPEANVATVEREGVDAELRARGRVAWMSSADAARLAPWVVIAPRAFVRDHQPALLAWTDAFFVGAEQLSRDVPVSARTLAEISGAPPVVDLLRHLGTYTTIPLREQAQLLGLSGRDAITLESLFARAWSIDRGIGVLTGPPPEQLPIATGTIASLIRRATPPEAPRIAFRPAPADARVLARFPLELPRVTRNPTALDPLVARIGFIAGAFPRSSIRIAVPREKQAIATAITERVISQYGIDPARITTVQAREAHLEVMPSS